MAEDLVLRSPLLSRLGVRHGFSTRLGGVSEGAYATLNVAIGPGDRVEAVAENLRRLCEAIGVARERLFQTSQVHGSAVRELGPDDDPSTVLHEEADALVARDGSQAVGVRVADCVPVLLFDEDTGHVAAAHAGWRGVVSGVVPNAASALLAGAPRARALVAAIGPCIGPCCFEVGDEVVEALLSSVPDDGRLVRLDRPKPHVDLRHAVRLQLRSIGVADERITDVPVAASNASVPGSTGPSGCTRCDATRFFSFRRDGARSGRHLGLIAPRSPR